MSDAAIYQILFSYNLSKLRHRLPVPYIKICDIILFLNLTTLDKNKENLLESFQGDESNQVSFRYFKFLSNLKVILYWLFYLEVIILHVCSYLGHKHNL